MPISYGFKCAATGDNVLLRDIDDALRKVSGLPENAHKFSFEFDALVSLGIVCTANGNFDNDVFLELNQGLSKDFVDIMRTFLNGEYQFWCYR